MTMSTPPFVTDALTTISMKEILEEWKRRYSTYNFLITPSLRMTHYCVVEDLTTLNIQLCMPYWWKISSVIFHVILKRLLQNYMKILKTCFLITTRRVWDGKNGSERGKSECYVANIVRTFARLRFKFLFWISEASASEIQYEMSSRYHVISICDTRTAYT